MRTYKDIISEITSAIEDIKDQKLKELAFQRLLEDALEKDGPKHTPDFSRKPPENVSGEETPAPTLMSREKRTKSRKNGSFVPYRVSAVNPKVKAAFDRFDPNQSDLKPFKVIKQKIEKYLWVLEYGRKTGIETMTSNEIAYVLGSKLLESVTEKQVNNLKQKIKDGYVTKWDTGWKILQKGIDLVSASSIKKAS